MSRHAEDGAGFEATHELAVWEVDAGAATGRVNEVTRVQLPSGAAPAHVALNSSSGKLQLVTTGPTKLQFWTLALLVSGPCLVPEQAHLQAHTDFKQRVRRHGLADAAIHDMCLAPWPGAIQSHAMEHQKGYQMQLTYRVMTVPTFIPTNLNRNGWGCGTTERCGRRSWRSWPVMPCPRALEYLSI